MKKIYHEICRHTGKIPEFASYLVQEGIYENKTQAIDVLRHNTREVPKVTEAYAIWKVGRLRTKDMKKHVDKLATVFKEIKTRTAKAEYESIVEVLEEALKETSLAIKNKDLSKLPEVKRLLEEALYGRQE